MIRFYCDKCGAELIWLSSNIAQNNIYANCVQWHKILIVMDIKHMTQPQECFLIYAQIVELLY